MFTEIKMRYLICILLSFTSLVAEEESLEPLYEYLLQVVEHSSNAHPPIVAIGGCPGVGKTVLTKKIYTALQEKGIRSQILPLDDFNLSPEERLKIGTEWDIRHLKVTELHACLSSIFAGASQVQKPFTNQLTGEAGYEFVSLEDIDLILFDGLYTLCDIPPLNFFDYCETGIFLDADVEDIRKWKWERELRKNKPRTPEQFVKHMEVIFNEFNQNVSYSRKNAYFIIQADSEHHYQLEKKGIKNDRLRAA